MCSRPLPDCVGSGSSAALGTARGCGSVLAYVWDHCQAKRSVEGLWGSTCSEYAPGVPLTHANMVASMRNIAASYELSGEDRR
jgi:hypothetical protein